jgi:hypothetical protein
LTSVMSTLPASIPANAIWQTARGIFCAAALAWMSHAYGAEEPVFSGPQAGEKITPFKVVDVAPGAEAKERDPITEHAGTPTALVFVHTVERSLVPLLRVVDEYGASQKERLKTEIIFLAGDRLAGEERSKAVSGSLKLHSRVGLSIDGAEGPGNYGLNTKCMMTIVIAKENKVIANFALGQPGISDAPKIIQALAVACGDQAPPTAEELMARRNPPGGGRAMAREQLDLSKLELNTEAGLRESTRSLIAEVTRLRAEVAELRGAGAAQTAAKPKVNIPGAVPTDEKLTSLLRRFIRPTNDEAAVDQVLAEVEAHIKDNADLKQQALQGWIRILHFENYGTPYSRKTGQEFVARLKQK